MAPEYILTFSQEELTLLIDCLQKEILTKRREPEVEIEPGVFTRAPQHSALLEKILDERDVTLARLTNSVC